MGTRARALVESAIGTEVAEGPLARALRALAGEGGTVSPIPAGNGVVFRPGLPTSAPYYATWPEVRAIVALEQGDVTVYVDPTSAPCVVTGTAAQNNGFGRLVISPAAYVFTAGLIELEIADGASLDNVRCFRGPLKILSGRTGTNPPALSHSGVDITLLSEGAQLALKATATKSFIDVPADTTFGLGIEKGAGLDNSAAPTIPIVEILPGATATHAWFVLDGAGIQNGGLVRGGANAIFLYSHDLTTGGVDVSLLTGGGPGQTVRQLTAFSPDLTFKPGAPYGELGATEFALWDDILLNVDPSQGANRVYSPKTLHVDATYAPGGTAVVPAPAVPGAYLFNGPTAWKGADSGAGTPVSFADGVQLGDSVSFEDIVMDVNNTVTPLITVNTDEIFHLGLTGRSAVFILGSQPLLGVLGAGAAVASVTLRDTATLAAGSTALSVMGATNRLDIDAHDQSSIFQDSLGYAAGGTGSVFLDGSASLAYTQTLAPLFAPDSPGSVPTLTTEGSFRRSFVAGDLVPIIGPLPLQLIVIHGLSERFVCVEVYDGTGDQIVVSDNVALTVVALNESSCSLRFPAPVVGVYHVVVRR